MKNQPKDVTQVSPAEAWRVLNDEPDAMLIDVRTRPEWMLVGVPDLSTLGRGPAFIEWQSFPTMNQNPEFATEMEATGAAPDTPLLFLCRSGNRSDAAARMMAASGHTRCYNVAEGFEGELDPSGHRGTVNGWKVAGLPWTQG